MVVVTCLSKHKILIKNVIEIKNVNKSLDLPNLLQSWLSLDMPNS